jgi:uncharacterized DUF497 family protein
LTGRFLWINEHLGRCQAPRDAPERGLDFADAELVFSGRSVTLPDWRRDYGKPRFITAGLLQDRFVVVVWTLRSDG